MEIRVAAGYGSVRDVDRMIAMMQAHFGKLGPCERYVIAADWRSVGMMSPETAARAKEMLSRSNPRVVRSSILTLPDRSLANLQVMRLVREAESEHRRHFTSAVEQHRWLSEVLTEEERTRLAAFLDLGSAVEEGAAPEASLPVPARTSLRPGRRARS